MAPATRYYCCHQPHNRMNCTEFLTNYSDFRDQVVGRAGMRRRFLAHMSRCRRCARYHEVIEHGVMQMRASENVEPSRRFRIGLRHRLAAAVIANEPIFPVPVRLVGSFILAAAVAMLVIEGLTPTGREPEPLAPTVRPMPMVRANPSPPFVTFADLKAPLSFGQQVSFQVAREYPLDPYVTIGDTVDRD